MEASDQFAALGRALQQLLLASYGLYPNDLESEVRLASVHLGGEDVMLLLADYDQRFLVRFEHDDRTFSIDGPGPGEAFRQRSRSRSRAVDRVGAFGCR